MEGPLRGEFAGPLVVHFFVYGTLRKQADTEQARFLKSQAQYVGSGRVNGRLYRVSYYPGLVLSSGLEEWVVGDVFRVLTPESLFRELDGYEGCGPSDTQPHEYWRQIVPVLLDSGAWIEADTYVYRWSVEGRELIASGDFFACD